jgi:hypothetical protein
MGATDDVSEPSSAGHGWGDLSRRAFLLRGTVAAAAAGMVGSVPGFSALLAGSASEAPALETGAGEAEVEAGGLAEPLVAQVKDLNTGEISLFHGEQEIVIRNPAMARSLFAAARH